MEVIALTVPSAMKALSLSRSTIYRLMASGQLETTMVGGRRLVKTDSIRALVAA